MMLTLSGALALGGLFSLTHFVKLDNLLLVSQAIYNVTSGVKGIGLGICRLLLGLVQMIGFTALAAIAVISVLAVASGSIRLCLKLLPQLASTWHFLAKGLNGFIQLLSLPHPHSQQHNSIKNKSRLRSSIHSSNPLHTTAKRVA
ncbi:MAG: hypothetical protein NWQ25_01225 [Prochlorococcaceae cyanobacterium MAG_34]|nr:hypothetical protein [Prochlorococcaceae cyanobacterium MAG_34]